MQRRSNLNISTGLFSLTFVPFLNICLLLLMFLGISSIFVYPNSTGITLPKTITSDLVPENTVTITVTGEDVIYLGNQVVSEKELKKALQALGRSGRSVLIKSENRSTLARMISVWNICRDSGLEKINFTTTVNK